LWKDSDRQHRGAPMTDSVVLLEQVPVGSYKNFTYIVADRASGESAMVDPAWEIQSLLSRIRESNLHLKYILNTHAHFDHVQGNSEISQKTGAAIVMHQTSFARKDIGVNDGDQLMLGQNTRLKFIHTPGHSPESMCIQVNDFALLTGDTLFIGECGRVDLPGGDPSALYDSFEKIRNLNPDLIVYPGHDYGKTPFATLGEELRTNYTLARKSREDFVKFMMSG
jgi:hydroxyacylglutathione hydrolase